MPGKWVSWLCLLPGLQGDSRLSYGSGLVSILSLSFPSEGDQQWPQPFFSWCQLVVIQGTSWLALGDPSVPFFYMVARGLGILCFLRCVWLMHSTRLTPSLILWYSSACPPPSEAVSRLRSSSTRAHLPQVPSLPSQYKPETAPEALRLNFLYYDLRPLCFSCHLQLEGRNHVILCIRRGDPALLIIHNVWRSCVICLNSDRRLSLCQCLWMIENSRTAKFSWFPKQQRNFQITAKSCTVELLFRLSLELLLWLWQL